MRLNRARISAVSLALMGILAAPAANSALMTTESGGVFTAINGFEFAGTTYNISFTETEWSGYSGLQFSASDAIGFATTLATELAGMATDLAFENGVDHIYTHALVPIFGNEGYMVYLQTDGLGWFEGKQITAGAGTDAEDSWDYNVAGDLSLNHEGKLRTNFTGMNISAVTAVPLPAAMYLFGAGVMGLLAAKRRRAVVSA